MPYFLCQLYNKHYRLKLRSHQSGAFGHVLDRASLVRYLAGNTVKFLENYLSLLWLSKICLRYYTPGDLNWPRNPQTHVDALYCLPFSNFVQFMQTFIGLTTMPTAGHLSLTSLSLTDIHLTAWDKWPLGKRADAHIMKTLHHTASAHCG